MCSHHTWYEHKTSFGPFRVNVHGPPVSYLRTCLQNMRCQLLQHSGMPTVKIKLVTCLLLLLLNAARSWLLAAHSNFDQHEERNSSSPNLFSVLCHGGAACASLGGWSEEPVAPQRPASPSGGRLGEVLQGGSCGPRPAGALRVAPAQTQRVGEACWLLLLHCH